MFWTRSSIERRSGREQRAIDTALEHPPTGSGRNHHPLVRIAVSFAIHDLIVMEPCRVGADRPRGAHHVTTLGSGVLPVATGQERFISCARMGEECPPGRLNEGAISMLATRQYGSPAACRHLDIFPLMSEIDLPHRLGHQIDDDFIGDTVM